MNRNNFYYLLIGLFIVFNLIINSAITIKNIWSTRTFDDSRDLLVAKHIVEFGENVRRGPWSDGGTLENTELQFLNSPFYYWYCALIWLIQPSIEGASMLWASILAIGFPLMAFLVGHALANKKTGLIFACLVIFNINFVRFTITIWQPHIALLALLISLYFFYKAYRDTSPSNAALALVLLALVPHFHLSSIVVVIFFIVFLILKIFQQHAQKANYTLITFSAFAILIGAGCYLYFTYDQIFGDQFIFIFKSIRNKLPFYGFTPENNFIHTIDRIIAGISWQSWLMTDSWNFRMTVVGLTASLIYSLNVKTVSSTMIKITHAAFWLSISIVYFLNNYLYDIYLIPMVGLNLLLYASATASALSFIKDTIANKFASYQTIKFWVLSITSMLVLLNLSAYAYFYQKNTAHFVYGKWPMTYQDMQQTVEAIHGDRIGLKKSGLQNYDSFTLAGILPYDRDYFGKDGWPTSGQWLLLEELNNRPLVRITDSRKMGAQFQPITKNPDSIYLTCLHTDKVNLQTIESEQSACIFRFLVSRPYLSENFQTIFTNPRISLFRFEKKYPQSAHIVTDEPVIQLH